MVSEIRLGFTIPVEINVTFHSNYQQFAVLITTTIIPKRTGRTKSIQLEGVGEKKIKNQCLSVRHKKSLKLQEFNRHINVFHLFLRTSLPALTSFFHGLPLLLLSSSFSSTFFFFLNHKAVLVRIRKNMVEPVSFFLLSSHDGILGWREETKLSQVRPLSSLRAWRVPAELGPPYNTQKTQRCKNVCEQIKPLAQKLFAMFTSI